MTDMTNIHSGTNPNQGRPNHFIGPLCEADEISLVQLLYEMILLETQLEKQKHVLAQQTDFSLMDAFQMVDDSNLGWVSAPQILTFLTRSGLHVHKDDIFTFSRRFDRDNDSKILFSDFCEAFTPKDSYFKHELEARRPIYLHNKKIRKIEYFTEQTRDVFFQTFKCYFEIDERIEISKKNLTRRPTFNIHNAFSCMDVHKRGFLNQNDFKKFMQKNGLHPTESEMTYLNARFDRCLNGSISYKEFMDEILPSKSLLGEFKTAASKSSLK